MITKKMVEDYVEKNNYEGKKIADVLRDFAKGYNNLGHICFFYGYNIDRAIAHLEEIEK